MPGRHRIARLELHGSDCKEKIARDRTSGAIMGFADEIFGDNDFSDEIPYPQIVGAKEFEWRKIVACQSKFP